MQITFIGHASILIETRGLRILSDPWWRGPCFGAQWWNYPPPFLEPVHAPVDYLYVSHGHHDHFHPGTLKTLDSDATVLVSGNIDVSDSIRELGFKVAAIGDDEEYTPVPGVKIRIMETHAHDTLFAIDDGERVCVNLNDSLHSTPDEVRERFIEKLRSIYPRIDYVFCGYGVASHFPNCYRIPGKDPEATAAKRQRYFNRRWSRIMAGLQPRFGFPFAADVAFLESDLIWANEPTHNSERPTEVFKTEHPESQTTVVDIAPGFQIADERITRGVLREPISLARLRNEYAEQIERANAYGTATDAAYEEALSLLRENAQLCVPYLQEYPDDYRFLVRFRNYPKGIAVEKRGGDIEVSAEPNSPTPRYDVTYVTRVHYVKFSLTTRYGHEILFVGSGGVFEYADAARARENLHRELATMLVPHESPPTSRYGSGSAFAYRLKRTVKRLLGRQPNDLYDLGAWTVWKQKAAE